MHLEWQPFELTIAVAAEVVVVAVEDAEEVIAMDSAVEVVHIRRDSWLLGVSSSKVVVIISVDVESIIQRF